jgi:hypothetical protein
MEAWSGYEAICIISSWSQVLVNLVCPRWKFERFLGVEQVLPSSWCASRSQKLKRKLLLIEWKVYHTNKLFCSALIFRSRKVGSLHWMSSKNIFDRKLSSIMCIIIMRGGATHATCHNVALCGMYGMHLCKKIVCTLHGNQVIAFLSCTREARIYLTSKLLWLPFFLRRKSLFRQGFLLSFHEVSLPSHKNYVIFWQRMNKM